MHMKQRKKKTYGGHDLRGAACSEEGGERRNSSPAHLARMDIREKRKEGSTIPWAKGKQGLVVNKERETTSFSLF